MGQQVDFWEKLKLLHMPIKYVQWYFGYEDHKFHNNKSLSWTSEVNKSIFVKNLILSIVIENTSGLLL